MNLARKIGYKAIELINKQIEQGIDYEGRKYSYSEKPFWRPYSKKVVDKLGGKKGAGEQYEVTSNPNTKKRGMVVLGGYKAYRRAFGRDPEGDFLQFSGNMLASMDVINADESNAEIGFTDKRAADIAFWLNISGAGRSRKLWKFMGLTKENLLELSDVSEIATEQDIETLVKSLIRNINI